MPNQHDKAWSLPNRQQITSQLDRCGLLSTHDLAGFKIHYMANCEELNITLW